MNRTIPLFATAMLIAMATSARAQNCERFANVQQYDLTDATAVLARALSATRFGTDATSGFFKSSVRASGVCLDSLPFLAAWTRSISKPRVALAPVQLAAVGNSAYPRGINDGVLWAGKGLNTMTSAGVEGRWRFLSGAVIPVLAYQQNADHSYVRSGFTGISPFANADHRNIDLPKRMGTESFSLLHPGQSFIRADVGPVMAAISTENLWLGAAQVQPILVSNTAPGFPHARIGTSRPVNLRVINLEMNVFWGAVTESDYFDGNPDNDQRLFTASSISIEPRFLRGLYLGVARVFHDTASATGQSPGFYLGRVIESPIYIGGGNRPGNAIGALYVRWVHPESGFEVYGEWSREDTPYNLEDVLREPDWTQAYGAGVQKVLIGTSRLTRIYAEMIHLGAGAATVRTGRGPYTTYTHAVVRQGHTNRGQILGAGVGPGSDAQRIGWDAYTANAMTGAFLERVRYDDDAYYTTFARNFGEARHDVELNLGVRRTQFFRGIQANAAVTLSRRWDRDFIQLRAGPGPAVIENNIGTQLSLRWVPDFF